MTLYDVYLSMKRQEEFGLWDLDDVDNVCKLENGRFCLLKYQQGFKLEMEGVVVGITPYVAGYSLGGCVWVIECGADRIVYAPEFNHGKEKCLPAGALGILERPSVLIVGGRGALVKGGRGGGGGGRGMGEMMEVCGEVLKDGGNVLVPVDTAGRVLEVALVVEDWWREFGGDVGGGCCCVLGNMVGPTFEFVRTMIEWMSDEVVNRFEGSRENAFDFKCLKRCASMAEFRALKGPVLCLAPSASLEYGFARDLFLDFAGNPSHAIVLVSRCEEGLLAAQLEKVAQARLDGAGSDQSLTINHRRKEYLQGEELRLYQEEELARKQKMKEEDIPAKDGNAAGEAESTGLVKTEPSDVEMTDLSGPLATAKEQSSNKRVRKGKRKNRFMFPYVKHIVVWDEYGQIVDMKRYATASFQDGGPSEHNNDLNAMEVVGVDKIEPTLPSASTQQAVESLPTKYVSSEISLEIKCKVLQYDCTGLSDGDSAKRLLTKLEPRRVVVIHGSEEEVLNLGSYLETALFTKSDVKKESITSSKPGSAKPILCPRDGETVDVTSNVYVTSIPLENDLLNSLGWLDSDGASLTYLDGKLVQDSELDKPKISLLRPVSTDENTGVVEEIAGGRQTEETEYETETKESDDEEASEEASRGHGTLYIGSVMLNRLKEVLRGEGLRAEFAGGALCVENPKSGSVVLVKKVGSEELVLEGSVCEEYFLIRDMLYRQMSVL